MLIVGENSFEGVHEPYHVLIRKWYELRQDKLFPSLDEFKASSYELEEYRMLSRIKHDPLDVFYFEAGAALEKLYGKELANKNLEELYNDFFRARAYEGYGQVIEEKRPIYEQRKFSTVVGNIGYYKLHLPFGKDQVENVATYIIPSSKFIKKAFDWVRIIDKTPWF